MPRLSLFTDGSVDNETGIGFGAYLAVTDLDTSPVILKEQVKVKQFENTSSTKLELQTLLWALDEALLLSTEKPPQVTIYSDSQNIVNLSTRRNNLESKNYYASSGNRLNNAELYQAFYKVMDDNHCLVLKVDGHKPQSLKNNVDRLFTLVDKTSRFALRIAMKATVK